MAAGIQGITPHHAKYFAWELSSRRAASEDDRLSQSRFDACVDLNPRQIKARRDALKSALEKRRHQAGRTQPLFTIRWAIV